MYVDNEELAIEIARFKESGVMSEKLGDQILKIAKNYATKGSFSGYTWKEDMIGAAVLTCVRYLKNFDVKKQEKPNPFAYITTICKNAFIACIREHKKHSFIKDALHSDLGKSYSGSELVSIDYTDFK